MSVQTYNPEVAIVQFISGKLNFSTMGEFNKTKAYLRFGIYDMDGNDILFISQGGYFASTAWSEGDDAYYAVLGSKFGAITADDGKEWLIDRANIRRVKNEKELGTLLTKACPIFKEMAEKILQ